MQFLLHFKYTAISLQHCQEDFFFYSEQGLTTHKREKSTSVGEANETLNPPCSQSCSNSQKPLLHRADNTDRF